MWIRVDTGLPRHRKTRQLIARLGLREGGLTCNLKLTPEATAIAILVTLWLETRIVAPNGTLLRWTEDDVAFAAGIVPGSFESKELVRALVDCKLLDEIEGGYYVHNWSTRNGEHLKKAEQKRIERERGKTGAGGPSPASSSVDVTVPVTVTVTRPVATPSLPRRTPVAATGQRQDGNGAPEQIGAPLERLLARLGPAGPGMASDADPAPEAPLGGRTAAEAPESAPARPVEDALAELGLVGPQAKTAAQLGHRLRHAGVGPAIIREAIRHYAERAPTIRNAFAYYQPGGAGFEDLRLRLGARFSEDEGARFKMLDGAWAVKP